MRAAPNLLAAAAKRCQTAAIAATDHLQQKDSQAAEHYATPYQSVLSMVFCAVHSIYRQLIM